MVGVILKNESVLRIRA